MLLLDSQAALWVLDDSPRLGPTARQIIVSATTVHVSAATVWELTIKAMLGKLSVPDKLASRLTEQGPRVPAYSGTAACPDKRTVAAAPCPRLGERLGAKPATR